MKKGQKVNKSSNNKSNQNHPGAAMHIDAARVESIAFN
jgi:hypothetical protein